MKKRSDQLRQRERRVLAWSLAVAVVVHVGAFALWPELPVEPLPGSDISVAPGSRGEGLGTYVDLFFGPPDIFEADGSLNREAPDRFLEADRMVRFSAGCATLVEVQRSPIRGRVHLTLSASGRVDAVELDRGTGDPCTDEVMLAVANDLFYRWLPSERFPAPVRLIQPITIAEAPR